MVEVPRIRDSWSKATRRERNMYGTPRWSIPVPGEAWRGAVEEACA
jgi:hypothetical protein